MLRASECHWTREYPLLNTWPDVEDSVTSLCLTPFLNGHSSSWQSQHVVIVYVDIFTIIIYNGYIFIPDRLTFVLL